MILDKLRIKRDPSLQYSDGPKGKGRNDQNKGSTGYKGKTKPAKGKTNRG
ncbi:MAG: hypothetical protein FWH47_04885 [Methanomassiliicoccaceae archaeon]|nr:hypothetical protein [Methanomassiliicoccaceae archaeon]